MSSSCRPRIVSLLASSTELVCALGCSQNLVARSHECDFPEDVTSKLPQISHPTFDITGSSLEIDQLVRAKLKNKEPLYEVDAVLMHQLNPDVIFTQTHCEVCAVSPANLPDAPPSCQRQVTALRAGTLAGIIEGFEQVGQVLNKQEEAAELIANIRAHVESVKRKLGDRPRPSIVCLEWISPLFAFGNWGPEIIQLAGARTDVGKVGEHSAAIPLETLMAADPEYILIAPCGFKVDRTLREMPSLFDLPGWGNLRAVRSNKVFVADGNLYFNRSSPSLFKSLDILTEILFPADFPRTFGKDVWQHYGEQAVSS